MRPLWFVLAVLWLTPAHGKGPMWSAPPGTFAVVHLKPKALGEGQMLKRLKDFPTGWKMATAIRADLVKVFGGDPLARLDGLTLYLSGPGKAPLVSLRGDGAVPVAQVRKAFQANGWTAAKVDRRAYLKAPSGDLGVVVTPTRLLLGAPRHLDRMARERGGAPGLNALLSKATGGKLAWFVARPPEPIGGTLALGKVPGAWGVLEPIWQGAELQAEIELSSPKQAMARTRALTQAQIDASQSPRAKKAGLTDLWRRPKLSPRKQYIDLRFKLRAEDLNHLLTLWGTMVDRSTSPAPSPAEVSPVAAPVATEWVKLPGGRFQMGSATGEPDERPVRTVTLKPFELAKTEVTVAQYRACVVAKVCRAPLALRERGCNWGVPGRDDHPINCVSYAGALKFARWANARLPTEAEWEYAARSGGQAQAAPWGDAPATCSRAVIYEGAKGCGQSSTAPVCSKPQGHSAQGVCDLAGNVYEWVQDAYAKDYSKAPTDGSKFEDKSERRVVRGGSWEVNAKAANASNRFHWRYSNQVPGVGFRLAR